MGKKKLALALPSPPQPGAPQALTAMLWQHFGPAAVVRSVRENKAVAACVALVLGGAAYSLLTRLAKRPRRDDKEGAQEEGDGDGDGETITRVVRRETRIAVDGLFVRRL